MSVLVDEESPPLICEYIPIPKVFHSFFLEGPFRNCLICNCVLVQEGVQYIVERAFLRGESIYEFAICLRCQFQLKEEFSRETMQRVAAHIEERVDVEDRRILLVKESTTDADPWIEKCILTKKLRKECDCYTIYAHCDGSDLLFSYMPYMISGDAMGELSKLLSKKSKESLDDFVEEFLGLPPDLTSDPHSPKVFVF